jgi:hypothetical protein
LSRDELPPDFSGSLDFDGLIRTLGRLEGEKVSVVLGGTQSNEAPGPPGVRVELCGELHRRGPHNLSDTECFSVGDDPGLRLPRAEFVSASLSTFEGMFYFQVAVQMKGINFVIGQPDLVGE